MISVIWKKMSTLGWVSGVAESENRTHLVFHLEHLGQDSIQQLKLARGADDLLVDVVADGKVLVDLAEDERMVADLP
jgi:hypothetical protein